MLATMILCSLAAFQGGEVPKQPTAAAQLAHAKKVRAEARGAEGAARIQALERALQAYRAVPAHWPDSGAVAAEAAFRSGEILRTLGRPGEARGAFQEAYDQGPGTDFAPRALLEIGHLHRRAGELDQALASYQRVATVQGALLRHLNDSREWIGKIRLERGEWELAAQAFADWAGNAEGPVEVVRAADLEVRAWIGLGELERAEARWKEVVARLEPLAAEPTQEAEDLRRALDRMQAPELLDRARKKLAGEPGA